MNGELLADGLNLTTRHIWRRGCTVGQCIVGAAETGIRCSRRG